MTGKPEHELPPLGDEGPNEETLRDDHAPSDFPDAAETIILRRIVMAGTELEQTYDRGVGSLFHRLRPLSADAVSLHTVLQTEWQINDLYASKPIIKQLLVDASYNNPNHLPKIYKFIFFSPRLGTSATQSVIPKNMLRETLNFLKHNPKVLDTNLFIVNPPLLYQSMIQVMRSMSPEFNAKCITIEGSPEDVPAMISLIEQMMTESNFEQMISEIAPKGSIKRLK